MATQMISSGRASKLLDKIKHLQVSKRRAIEQAKKGVHVLADTAVIGVGTAGFAYMQGRMGEKKVGPIPVELLGAAVFHGAALADIGGSGMSHQLHNLGHGAFAAYVAAFARGAGKVARAKKGLPSLAGAERLIDNLSGETEGGGAQDDATLMRLARRL